MVGHGSNNTVRMKRVERGLLMFIAVHLPFLGSHLSRLLWDDNIVLTSVGVLPGLWCVFEWARACRQKVQPRLAAIFLAAAVCYLCGVSSYAILEIAAIPAKYPSVADLFFLLVPVFLVSGLFWIRPQGRRPGYQSLQAANLTLVAAATTILAVVSVAPSLDILGETLLYVSTTLAYWIVSFAAAGFALIALLSFQWREKTPVVILLAATLTVFTMGVIPYSYDLIAHNYQPGSWYEIFWYSTPAILALAGRAFAKTAAADEPTAPVRALRSPRALPTLIVAGTIFVLGVIVAGTLGVVPGQFVMAASLLAAVAVGLRERAIKLIEDDLEGRLQAALGHARENEQRFKHFAQSSSDFLIETDASLTITRIMSGDNGSPAFAPEWLAGQRLISHGVDGIADRDPPFEHVRRTFEARESFKDFQYSYEGPTGKVWRQHSGTPVFDSHQAFLGYRIAVRDITLKKTLQIENDKKAAELARVVRALDSVQEAIVILDHVNRITYVNAATDAMRLVHQAWSPLGQTYAEAFPKLFAQHPGLLDEIRDDLGRLGAWKRELHVESLEGGDLYLDVRAAALADGGMILAASDITERKRRERSESVLTKKLAEAQKNEAIGKLAGSIAHDFNNIIAAIRAFAGLIVSDLPEGHLDRTFAQRIVGASDRAAELVKQILLFARAGSAEKEPLDLNTVIEELRNTIAPTLPAHISFSVEPLNAQAVVEGNAAQLLQVLMNLCLNGADAAHKTRGMLRVACDRVVLADELSGPRALGWSEINVPGQASAGAYLSILPVPEQVYFRVAVTDNGAGIPAAARPRLFEPFFTTKETSKGTGLGLPVVKSIADAHGAVIRISTSQSAGTEFQICFPACSAQPRQIVPAARDLDSFTGKESVLVVDDEVDVADGLALALQRFGYEAASVYGPEEALEAIGADPLAWDIVVSDQVMPKMRGLELARELKRLNSGLDIIICTGFSDTATEQKAIEAGASAFFFKPVASEIIAETIRRLRGGRP